MLIYEVIQYAINNVEEEGINIERTTIKRYLYEIFNLVKEFSGHAVHETEVEKYKNICQSMEHLCDSMKGPIEKGKLKLT